MVIFNCLQIVTTASEFGDNPVSQVSYFL